MRQISTLMLAVTLSLVSYGQGTDLDRKLSSRDSILLNKFWTKFRAAVETKDKVKLEALCQFPFYCRPCIADTTLKHNNHVTIKVTKQIFTESQYKLFFDNSISNEVNKHESFDTNMFYKDNNKPNGFSFSYTIIAPSKKKEGLKWEGLQGFIYLEKKNSGYKITGIDTVP